MKAILLNHLVVYEYRGFVFTMNKGAFKEAPWRWDFLNLNGQALEYDTAREDAKSAIDLYIQTSNLVQNIR
jgi:hypothetical protein